VGGLPIRKFPRGSSAARDVLQIPASVSSGRILINKLWEEEGESCYIKKGKKLAVGGPGILACSRVQKNDGINKKQRKKKKRKNLVLSSRGKNN